MYIHIHIYMLPPVVLRLQGEEGRLDERRLITIKQYNNNVNYK